MEAPNEPLLNRVALRRPGAEPARAADRPRARPDARRLVEAFAHKGVAIVLVLLLGVPALPLPTGGRPVARVLASNRRSSDLLVGPDRERAHAARR
jgi:hypothetical protein